MSPIELTHTICIAPVSKPRQTRRDKWLDPPRPCVAEYRAFADKLRLACAASRITIPHAGLSLTFHIAMPASWSQRRKREMRGQPHQQKPDIDNLTKAVLDALVPDDSVIWSLDKLEKRWADTAAITFGYTKAVSHSPLAPSPAQET